MKATKYVKYRAAAAAVEESTQPGEEKWVKRINLSPTVCFVFVFVYVLYLYLNL